MGDAIKVMFVCTGNSARSQMADRFARHFGQGRIEAYSAGLAKFRDIRDQIEARILELIRTLE